MWMILESIDYATQFLNLIQPGYITIQLAKYYIVERLAIKSGGKQGCILSALLFVLVLGWVMAQVNAHGYSMGSHSATKRS